MVILEGFQGCPENHVNVYITCVCANHELRIGCQMIKGDIWAKSGYPIQTIACSLNPFTAGC